MGIRDQALSFGVGRLIRCGSNVSLPFCEGRGSVFR